MERFKVITEVLSTDDIHILQESLWHSLQRGDVSDEDRKRMYALRDKLKICDEKRYQ